MYEYNKLTRTTYYLIVNGSHNICFGLQVNASESFQTHIRAFTQTSFSMSLKTFI